MIARRRLVAATPAMAACALAVPCVRPVAAQTAVLKFGQSASLSGGQAKYGADVRDGIQAAFDAASKADAVRGYRFELTALDDGGERDRCKANVKSLIEAGVLAITGLTSGAGAEACLPLTEEARIAMLGTASGNMGVRDPKLTSVYHVRAGYDEEYRRMVRYVKEFGMTRVGYVRLKDTSPANEKAMSAALENQGIHLTETVALDRNAKSFEAEAKQLLAGNLQCVLFTTNAAPIVSIIDLMARERYNGFYFSSSFAGQSLIDAMAQRGISIIMSQVVPRPNAIALPVVKTFQQDLATLHKDAKPGYTNFEGYITGRVAVEAARLAARGGPVTRGRFREALGALSVDLGGYSVQFSANNFSGSRLVDVVAIDRSGRLIG
jgi:ABC-type branched-subunit amino acid transport system substrate-binding protein